MVNLDERLTSVLQILQGRLDHPGTDSVLVVLPITASCYWAATQA